MISPDAKAVMDVWPAGWPAKEKVRLALQLFEKVPPQNSSSAPSAQPPSGHRSLASPPRVKDGSSRSVMTKTPRENAPGDPLPGLAKCLPPPFPVWAEGSKPRGTLKAAGDPAQGTGSVVWSVHPA
ncbi:MAG: hypothetical protein LBQ12_00965 [Deltaproteobacteria bacterium]|nr:hypothetical protein [Deltaproteobacteria bacterium]